MSPNKARRRLPMRALVQLPDYKRWLRAMQPVQAPKHDDRDAARGIIQSALVLLLGYVALGVLIATTLSGCSGGGGGGASTQSGTPAAVADPPASTPPASGSNGGRSDPPPPDDIGTRVLGKGWLATVTSTGLLTRSGGLCLADYPADRSEPILMCSDTLDYNAFIAARYVARSGWTWIALDTGNVRGERWRWPLNADGSLRGDRITDGVYGQSPGLGNPLALRFVPSPSPYELAPDGLRWQPGAVSLAGLHTAYCDRVPCSVEISPEGELTATTSTCSIHGQLQGDLRGVVRGTLSGCDGNTYVALAATTPRSVNSATGADWSESHIAVLGYHGASDQLVIANAGAPRVPVAYVPPIAPPVSDPGEPAPPVPPLVPALHVTLTAGSAVVAPGSDITLMWTSDADFCLSSWSGSVPPTGTDTLRMTLPRVFDLSCNVQGAANDRAVRASVSVDVRDDSGPSCEVTDTCVPDPLAVPAAGAWSNESAYCEFTTGGSFYCTEARNGQRATFQGTFTSAGEAHGTSCYLAGGDPLGDWVASVDSAAAPTRIGVYIAPEWQWPTMRPAAVWDSAPRCPL